ncbi:hypothetical protein NESM_000353100 [Novymonas esmeraldas]|uniref:Uncharacterized protein n=1 Tax=Novymonas esmeraldas TaxID=1808958 RepID=A0AAW0EL75_9TRYP
MASERALESARAFCGQTLYAASAMHARVPLTDVAPSVEGLRTLAANGNWSEVLTLAERLEAEVAVKALRHPSKYASVPWSTTPPNPSLRAGPHHAETDATVRLSTDAAIRSARLPFVLVQVTANLKMRRIAAVKKIIDGLGDIEGDGFRHPTTRESFAPFSLRLVAALLPLYVGVPMEAQRKLYALLEETLAQERQCVAASGDARSGSPDAGDEDAARQTTPVTALRRTWAQRVLRVQRALLHVHIHTSQHSLAHALAERVLRSECASRRTSGELSEELSQLRYVLQLQQLFCLALHIGDPSRAQATRNDIEGATVASGPASDGDETPSTVLSNARLFHLVRLSCDAFLAVFRGDYGTAVQLLSDVVGIATRAKQVLRAADPGAHGDDGQVAVAPVGVLSEEALRRWVLQDICASAQVSHATSLAYRSDADPTTLMSDLCGTLEKYAKAEPQVLCHSDAFVESLVRFYTLAGDRKSNLDRLADLMEVFRCDRGSLPSLEALV